MHHAKLESTLVQHSQCYSPISQTSHYSKPTLQLTEISINILQKQELPTSNKREFKSTFISGDGKISGLWEWIKDEQWGTRGHLEQWTTCNDGFNMASTRLHDAENLYGFS